MNEPSHYHNNNEDMIDEVGKVESYGVEYIPEEHRRSKPANILWILFGGSMSLGIIVVGWIPVSLGLGWWEAISAVIVGSLIGATFLAPMGLFGLRTGTNNPVSSGAHYGAVGRIIGSVLGITADLVFAALCIWAAGQVLAVSVARIFGFGDAPIWLLIIAYTLVAIIMTWVSVLGHANMVAFTKWMVPTSGAVMLLAIFVLFPSFDPSYSGGEYALGDFWPTWLAGMLACAGTINSYGPYAGDWTRHISRKNYSDKKIMLACWIGGFFGMGGAFAFGAFTAVSFANPMAEYAEEFALNVPFWFLFLLLYVGFVPGTAQAVINIYNMGLDFSSIFASITRVQATIFLSIISTVLVYFGAFYQNLSPILSSYLSILIVLGAPWVVINLIGFFNCRGYYDPDALQVFNRGEIGGIYWAHKGLNYRAAISWLIAVIAGMLFVNTGWYVGPGASLLNGTDAGFVISTVLAAALYTTSLYVFPEPHYVFGPEGPRLKSKQTKKIPPIEHKRASIK